MACMNNVLSVVALSGLVACAAPYAPQEFNFSGWSSGMIESALDAPHDIHAFHEAMEHEVNPQLAQRLLIRLDDGGALMVRSHAQRFEPGQRVRIVAGGVEPE
jgi:hypothetical protein